jgi:hypothetical protein
VGGWPIQWFAAIGKTSEKQNSLSSGSSGYKEELNGADFDCEEFFRKQDSQNIEIDCESSWHSAQCGYQSQYRFTCYGSAST